MVQNLKIPAGFKQTDIGTIPNDWSLEKFVDCSDIITCGVAATPEYVSASAGKPFLSAQNVRKGRVVFENYKFIPRKLFNQITKHNMAKVGDLLYTRVGAGIGEAGVVEKNLDFGIYVSLTLIRTKPKKLHNYFLLYLLNSPKYRFLAKSGQFAGGGVQNLNVEIVREFLLPIPELKEQLKIGEVLCEIDNLIQSFESLVRKKRNIKQGAMQELLTGKRRLPGFNGEWEESNLGKIVEIRRGQLITSSTIKEGDIPVIAGGKTPAYYHDQANRFGKTITISASGASAGFVAMYSTPIFASDCSTIEDSPGISIDFIYYWLLLAQDKIYYLQTGGAQPHIHPSDLVPMPLKIPKKDEQTAIAQVLSDMDIEIESLEKQKAKYIDLKQGMMQQLLTGKIRLI